MRLTDVGDNSHPLLGPGKITGAHELGPFPDAQVASTIAVMRRRVIEDCYNPDFRSHAARVLNWISEPDSVSAAWRQTRNAINFVHDKELAGDIPGVNQDNVVEFIIRPLEMARLIDRGTAHGDCDDFCMYCECLLECCGIPTSFVTVAADDSQPDQYSHVYVRAYPYENGRKGDYVALDPSHGAYPGWECPDYFGKQKEWPVDQPFLWS